MDEKNFPDEFEETPWIFPLINKGTIDIMDLADKVASKTGQDVEKVKDLIRLYNKSVLKFLKEGKSVEYLGIGVLYPTLNDDGELIDVSFEASEEFLKKMEDNMRSNPSLN